MNTKKLNRVIHNNNVTQKIPKNIIKIVEKISISVTFDEFEYIVNI